MLFLQADRKNVALLEREEKNIGEVSSSNILRSPV